MRVLVTGAKGFIGKNLLMRFQERCDIEVITFTREDDIDDLAGMLEGVDWIFHLAGVNRPKNSWELNNGNKKLTVEICAAIKSSKKNIPIVYTSSIQAELDNDYGESKRAAEDALLELKRETGNPVFIYRLPNVFGKWSRPNYNSVVATFCYKITRSMPIEINDPSAVIRLVYVDDVVACFMDLINLGSLASSALDVSYVDARPVYQISVGELAEQLIRFNATRKNLVVERVGTGLVRALYSTFVSFLPPEKFTYTLQQHGDSRGVFVEMLKTQDSGQFSFFTAHPGITRGGHYHHSKTEKFLVIKGRACFRFRHMLTGEFYELYTSGEQAEIVESVPGWAHDITNVGEEELVCMLWANEIFDQGKPDTFARQLTV